MAVQSEAPQDRLHDRDGDGLDDALEAGQCSAPDLVDSDGDGWNDAEELARGSLATAHDSQPDAQAHSLGAAAYMRAGRLHVAWALYVRSGSLRGVDIAIGMRAFDRMVPIAPASYSHMATLTSVPTRNPGELLLVLDIVVANTPLLGTGTMSVYATSSLQGVVKAAAAVNLVMLGDTPAALITPAQWSPAAQELLGPGLMHRPLGGTPPPNGWSSGEVCFQQLAAVGTHGAVVTQEVTTASCVNGWDAYCDGGSCSSSVGTTVDLVDPSALIGG
ncbi:MAG: hypothetical protein ABI054_01135 [Planctomycetota bacterium]